MFIVFDGPDGTGKSTQIALLKEKLESAGARVTVTREPGGCPLSEKIRLLLLDPQNRGMDPMAEALLYAAARAQHLEDTVLPALARGETVLCDRYLLSSLAYQGYGRELGTDWILSINRAALEKAMPDATFLFEMDAKTAMDRKRVQSGHELDRIELEKAAFHRRVAEGFDLCRSAYPDIYALDAAQTVEEIRDRIWRVIAQLQKRGSSCIIDSGTRAEP